MTRLLPSAEHMLDLGIRRAVAMIRIGRPDHALRALLVATQAAELIQSEAETLVDAQLGQGTRP